jgi:hypothetical protein
MPGAPEVSVRIDHSRTSTRSTAYSFDIDRRSFCLLVATVSSGGTSVPLIRLRAEPDERQALRTAGHPFFAPRAGPDHLGVLLSADTDWEEICQLVTDSYGILAPEKLTALLD